MCIRDRGVLARWGLFRPAHGEPGNEDCGNVGEVMDSVADESDRMAYVASGEFDGNESEGDNNGRAENAGHAPRM